jgi:tetratricopeptide (TPR) repeat protein
MTDSTVSDGARGAGSTISACMIVKNEEALLPRCLESIKGWVDEIVVVDTGSTDGTVEIARKYGALIHHHPWEDHFSKHRNQSIMYASCRWIFVIDADEELIAGSGPALREAALVDESVDAIFVKVECEFDEGRGASVHNSPRLFRNNGVIRYKGRVHNEIVGETNIRYAPNIRLFHYGYNLGAEMAEKKFKRTTELLKRDIEEDPDYPRPHHYLAVSYLGMSMFEEAAREAETAIHLYKKGSLKNSEFLKSFFVAAMAHINLGRFDKAETFALEAIEMYPKHLDSHFALSWIYLEQKKLAPFWKHVRSYFEIAGELRENPEQFGAIIHSSANSLWFAHFFKAYALLLEGKEAESGDELGMALSLCPDRSEFHRLLGRYYRVKGDNERAEKEFLKGLELAPGKQSLLWDLYSLYRESGGQEKQEQWLQKIMDHTPDNESALFDLGVVKLKRGDFGQALSLFSRVLEKNEGRTDAVVNASICLRKLGRLEESLELAGRAKRLEPHSLDVLANFAYGLYETGDRDQAVAAFTEMVGRYPDEIDGHAHLATLHFQAGNLEACVRDCDEMMRILGLPRDRVLQSLTDFGSLCLEIGTRLSERNRPRLASLCFDIAVGVGLDDSSALMAMANSLIAAGAFAQAVSYLEKAAKADPGNAAVLSLAEELTDKLGKMISP